MEADLGDGIYVRLETTEGKEGLLESYYEVIDFKASEEEKKVSLMNSNNNEEQNSSPGSDSKNKNDQIKIRKKIHVLFSLILIATILIFKYFIADESVIVKIFTFANYTYGPLLGLYAFGLFTKLKIKDRFAPIICILSPFVTYIVNDFTLIFTGFDFGFSLLILNGIVTFIGLYLIKIK